MVLRTRPIGAFAIALSLSALSLPAAGQLVTPAEGQPGWPGSAWRMGGTRITLAADLNDDGWPDMVAGAFGLRVALNNGHGIFTPGGFTPDGPLIYGLAAGDLNGDGHVDIVASANSADGHVLTWLGNGTGALAATEDRLVPDPLAIELADFDLDGQLDVVTSHASTGITVHTLRGLGDGTLEPPVAHGTTGFIQGIDVADWDGDGDPDVYAATTSAVRLLLWNGTTLQQQYFSGTTAKAPLAFSDLDADGDLDLLNGYSILSGNWLVRRTNTDGLISPPQSTAVAAATVMAVERDPADGFPDVLIGGGTSVTLCTNTNGIPVPKPPVTLAQSLEFLHFVDFNGDGHADAMASDQTANTAAVLFGSANGTLGTSPRLPIPGAAYCNSVGLAHLDGDGRLDLVVADRDAPALRTAPGAAGTHFGPWSSQPTEYQPVDMHLRDMNLDGLTDVVLLSYSTNGLLDDDLVVHLGDGTGGLGPALLTSFTPRPYRFDVGDLDDDGVPDAAVLQQESGSTDAVQAWLGTGTGHFTIAGKQLLGDDAQAIALGDVNDDGLLDAVVARSGGVFPAGHELLVFTGDGLGGFAAPQSVPDIAPLAGEVLVVDFDADGLADIVGSSNGAGSVFLLRGDGAGGFAAPLLGGMSGSAPRGLLAADVDDDGHLDLLQNTLFEAVVHITRGDGQGGFHDPTAHPGSRGGGVRSIAAGDLDLDGSTDIVQLGSADDDVTLLFRSASADNAWASIGGGVDGVAGQPRLRGSGTPVAGQLLTLDVDRAAPDAPLFLLLGTRLLDQPLKGGRLVPAPDLIVAPLLTDASGSLQLADTWPAGIPAGTVLWLQAWIVDDAALEGVSATGGYSLRSL